MTVGLAKQPTVFFDTHKLTCYQIKLDKGLNPGQETEQQEVPVSLSGLLIDTDTDVVLCLLHSSEST